MSTILVNLAMIIGFCFCLLSMVLGFAQGVSFWTVLFRSAIVLAIGTVITMAFFRFFNIVLYRFLGEKLKEHREQMEEEQELEGEEVVEE